MRCKVCGREAMNPEANFCDYCGSSFRQFGGQEAAASEQKERGYSAFGTANGYTTMEPGREQGSGEREKPVTVWTYLGMLLSMLLIFVPYGFLVFVGILLYWGFAAGSSPNRRAFARALLIFFGVMMLFAAFSMAAMMESGMFDSIFEQMGVNAG